MKNFDPKITQLVSYPRCGSHWVRLILEQYLDKYCLPTSFFNKKDYWGYHLHDRVVGKGDEGLTGGFDKVVYLYRKPTDTIFSLLMYENIDPFNLNNVEIISNEYYNHLNRWLYHNEDCHEIIFIKYDDIMNNHLVEFEKIICFLGFEFDIHKLDRIYKEFSIKKSKEHILDPKVINQGHFDGNYSKIKKEFYEKFDHTINKKFENIWK